MTSVRKGLIIAMVHVLLVGSIGAKFLIDRDHYPRVWIVTQPFDPNLPIRGRYVRLSALVKMEDQTTPTSSFATKRVRLVVRDEALVAISDEHGHQDVRATSCSLERCWVLTEPLAYFIPEHIADPSRRKPGEELWVEATIPPNGPPRPIRLGVKSGGAMTVLDIR